MKKHLNTICKIALSAIFAIAAYIFFAVFYKHHLHYHELYQMFMFTGDYAAKVIWCPGGLAEYASRFLVQFFFVSVWGAVIMAVLLAGLQLLTAWAMRVRSIAYYAFSFVPAIAMWMALCDENTMPTACIALMMTVAVFAALSRVKDYGLLSILAALLTPILYLAAGPIGLAFPILMISIAIKDKASLRNKILSAGAWLFIAIACPLLAEHIFPYPLERLLMGISYFRFPFVSPTMAWIATLCAVVVIAAAAWLPERWRKENWACGLASIAAIGIFAVLGVRASTNMDKEAVFGYEYMARNSRWGDIVAAAMEKQPDKPLSVAALNLALAKSGAMSDHMFHFYQNGEQGLIPKFERDPLIPLFPGEVFYHLGMINSAQRYYYEAQEAIPDYQKSAAMHKRLAETHIVNGDYEAARKYLQSLKSTLLYSRWAREALVLLGNEEAINRHPVFGHLRQMRYKTDVFFSDDEMDSMFGLLFLDNKSNKMAFEYLLATALLNRDLDRFYECYVLGKDLGYDHIPASYQEALALKWTMEHDSWAGLPYSLSPQVMQRMQQYINDRAMNRPDLDQAYANTYWKYYFD